MKCLGKEENPLSSSTAQLLQPTSWGLNICHCTSLHCNFPLFPWTGQLLPFRRGELTVLL